MTKWASLYKDKGGRSSFCHPYLVKKRMTRHTPLLQEKAHRAVRDKQDLRKGREKTRHSFLSQPLFFMKTPVRVSRFERLPLADVRT